ncbi:hypothetical protein OG21DRAFT_1494411 [Imleria badia]|nr:hypothetical protein OG21DRAFT_1494411 [Imleria badia]
MTTSSPSGRAPSKSHAQSCSPPAQTTPPALSLSQVLNVFKLPTEIYPRYIDTPSRDAVEDIGMHLVRKDESIRDALNLSVLKIVVCKPSAYPSQHQVDFIVLLIWSCGLYTTCISASPEFTHGMSSPNLRHPPRSPAQPSAHSKPTTQKVHSFAHAHKVKPASLVYVPLLSTATSPPLTSDRDTATNGRAHRHPPAGQGVYQQALVPMLLKVLVDPGKTTNVRSVFLKTLLMHYIDHSSLAPCGQVKAAQIVGNLVSLTDSKDYVPYMWMLLASRNARNYQGIYLLLSDIVYT